MNTSNADLATIFEMAVFLKQGHLTNKAIVELYKPKKVSGQIVH